MLHQIGKGQSGQIPENKAIIPDKVAINEQTCTDPKGKQNEHRHERTRRTDGPDHESDQTNIEEASESEPERRDWRWPIFPATFKTPLYPPHDEVCSINQEMGARQDDDGIQECPP